jgi:F0F1-type ATP synthase beta subunit
MNVIASGEPIDECKVSSSPPFMLTHLCSSTTEVLETDIKVVDLLSP